MLEPIGARTLMSRTQQRQPRHRACQWTDSLHILQEASTPTVEQILKRVPDGVSVRERVSNRSSRVLHS